MGFEKCHLLFGCGIMKFFIISLFLLLLFDSPQGSTLSPRRSGKGLNTTLQTNFNGTYERTNPCNNEQVETSHYTATHEYHHHSKENNWNDYSNKCVAIIGSFIQAIGKLIHLNNTEGGKFNFHINTTISQSQVGHCAENKSCIPPTIVIEATDCKITPNSSKDFENSCKKSSCKTVEPCKTFKMQKYSRTGVSSSKDNKTADEICPWEKGNEKIIITSCEEETPLKSHEQEHEGCPTECHETTSTSQQSLTKYPTQPVDQSSGEEKTSSGVENLTTPFDFPSRGTQNVPSQFPFTEISASTPAVFDDVPTTDSYGIITTRSRPEDEFTTTYSPNENEPSSTNSFNTDPTQLETSQEFSPISTPLTSPTSYPPMETGLPKGKYSHYRHKTTTKNPTEEDNFSNNIPESTPYERPPTFPDSSSSYQTPDPPTSEFPTTKFTDQPTSSTSLDDESPHSTVTPFSHSPSFTSLGLEPTDSPLTSVPTFDNEHVTTEFHGTGTPKWQSSPDYSTTHDDTTASSPSDFTNEPTPTSPSYTESPSSTLTAFDQFSSTPYPQSATDNNDTTESPLTSVTPDDNEDRTTELHTTVTPEWQSEPDYSSSYSHDVTTASTSSDFSPQPVPSTLERESPLSTVTPLDQFSSVPSSQLPADDYKTTEIRPYPWSTTEEETPMTPMTTLPPETETQFDHENVTTTVPPSDYSEEPTPSTLSAATESTFTTVTPFDQYSSNPFSQSPSNNFDTAHTSLSPYDNENITTELHSTGTPEWRSSSDYTNQYKNDETESTTSQFSDEPTPTSPDIASSFSSITTFGSLPSSNTPKQETTDNYETTELQRYSSIAFEDETTTANIQTSFPSESQTATENDTTTGVTDSVLYDHQTPSGTVEPESQVTDKTPSDQYLSTISTEQPTGNYETLVPELSTLDTSQEETTPTVSSYPPRTSHTTQSPASDFYDEPTSGTFAGNETPFSSSTTIDQFSSTPSTEEKLVDDDTSMPSQSPGSTYPVETTTDKIQTTDRSDSPSSLEYDNETTTESPASDFSDEQSPSSPSEIKSPFPTITPLSSTPYSQSPTGNETTETPLTSVTPDDNEDITTEFGTSGTPEWRSSPDYSTSYSHDMTTVSVPTDFSDEPDTSSPTDTGSPFSTIRPFGELSSSTFPYQEMTETNEPQPSTKPTSEETHLTQTPTTVSPESETPFDYGNDTTMELPPSYHSEEPTPSTLPNTESRTSSATPFDQFSSTPNSQSTTHNYDTTETPLTTLTPDDSENITTELHSTGTPEWQSSPYYTSPHINEETGSTPSEFSEGPTSSVPESESPFTTESPVDQFTSTSFSQSSTDNYETTETQLLSETPLEDENTTTNIQTKSPSESRTPLEFNDTTTGITDSVLYDHQTPRGTMEPESLITDKIPSDQPSSEEHPMGHDITEFPLTSVSSYENEKISTEFSATGSPEWQSSSPDYSSPYSHDVTTASIPSHLSSESIITAPADTESPFSTITPITELSSSTSPQGTTETSETNETQPLSSISSDATQFPTTTPPKSETPFDHENVTTTVPPSDYSEEPTPSTFSADTESTFTTVTPFDQFSSTPFSQSPSDNYDTTESPHTSVSPYDNENITTELHSTGTPEWQSSPDNSSPYSHDFTAASSDFSRKPTPTSPYTALPFSTVTSLDHFSTTPYSQSTTDNNDITESPLTSETPDDKENITNEFGTTKTPEWQSSSPYYSSLHSHDVTTASIPSHLSSEPIITTPTDTESPFSTITPFDELSSSTSPQETTETFETNESQPISTTNLEDETSVTQFPTTIPPESETPFDQENDTTTELPPSDYYEVPTPSTLAETKSSSSTAIPFDQFPSTPFSQSPSYNYETTESFLTSVTPDDKENITTQIHTTGTPEWQSSPDYSSPYTMDDTSESPTSGFSYEGTPSTISETVSETTSDSTVRKSSPSTEYMTSVSGYTAKDSSSYSDVPSNHTSITPFYDSSPTSDAPLTSLSTEEESFRDNQTHTTLSPHEPHTSLDYEGVSSKPLPFSGEYDTPYPYEVVDASVTTPMPGSELSSEQTLAIISSPATQSSTDIFTSDSPSKANPTGGNYHDSLYSTTQNPSQSTAYPMNHQTVSENEPPATYQPPFAPESQTTVSESPYVGPETTAFPSEIEPTASPSSIEYQSIIVPSVTPEDLGYSTQMSTSAPPVTYTPIGEQSPEAPFNGTKPSTESFVTDQSTSAQTISESSTTPTDGYASYGQTHANPDLESESLISTVGNDQSPPGKFQPSHVPESGTETTLPYSNEPSVDYESSSTERVPVDDPLKTTPWPISTTETIAQNDFSQPEYISTTYNSSSIAADYSRTAEFSFSTTPTFETEPGEQPPTTLDASHSPQPTNNALDHFSSTASPQFTPSSYNEDTTVTTDYPLESTQPLEDDYSEVPSSVNRFSTTSHPSYPTEPQYSTSTIRPSEDYPTPSGTPLDYSEGALFTEDESLSPSVLPASSTYVDERTSSSEGMPTYPPSPASDPQPQPSADYRTEIPDYQTTNNPSQTFDYTSSDEFTTIGPNASTTESKHQTMYPYTGTETDFDKNLTVLTTVKHSELSNQSDSVTISPTPDIGISTDDVSPDEVITPSTTLETYRTEETSERFSPQPTTAVSYDEEITTEYPTSPAPQSQPQTTMKPVDPHSDDIPNASPDQPVTVSPSESEPTSEFTYDLPTTETSGSETYTQTTFSKTSPEIQYTTSPMEQTYSEITTTEHSLVHTSQPQPYFSSQKPVSSTTAPFYTNESQPTESSIPTDQSPEATQTTPALYSPFPSTVSPQGSSDYLDDETAPVSDAPAEGKSTGQHLQETTPHSDPFSKYNVRKRPEGETLFGPKTSPMYFENTGEEYSNNHSSTLSSDYTTETTPTLDTDNTVPTDRQTFDGPTEEQPITTEADSPSGFDFEEGTRHPPTKSSTNAPPTEPSDSLFQTNESNMFSPFHVTTPQRDLTFSEGSTNTSPIPAETSSFEQTQNATSTTPPYLRETDSNFVPYQSTQPNAGISTTQDVTITTQSDSHTLVSDLTTPSDESSEDCISRCKQHDMPAAPLLCPFDPILKGNMTAPSYYILISKLPVGDKDDERFQVEKVYLGDGTPLNCTDNIRKTFPTSWYTSVPIKSAGTEIPGQETFIQITPQRQAE